MAAATASAKVTGASYLHHSSGSDLRRLGPPKKVTGYTKFSIHFPNCFSSTRVKGYFPIRALDPQRGGEKEEEENSSITNDSQDDLEYLGKLVAGSIAGAALIKYGSIVFPEITRPNLIQALIIILTPVIVAALLLLQQSRAEGRS